MKEEIKRTIDDLEFCNGVFDYTLSPEQSVLLVGYIKELQQENQQLKEKNEIYKRQRKRWSSRSHKLATKCDKYKFVLDEIREHINSQMYYYDDDGDCGVDCCCDGFKLLQILDKVKK